MIIDSTLVFVDSAPLTAAVTSREVPLTSFQNPGREEPIPVCIRVTPDVAGGTSLTVQMQQADKRGGTYADVPGSVTVSLADLQGGKRVGFRFLPHGVSKPWCKLKVTAQGTFNAGKLFAAIMREDELPYTDGLYIDRGEVLG